MERTCKAILWRGVAGWVLPVVFCLVAGEARALDMDRVRPKEVPVASEPTTLPTAPAKPSGADPDQVLVAPLRGLVFLSDPDRVVRQGTGLSGVVVDSALSKTFSDEMNGYLGRPLTLGELREIVGKTVAYFRSQDTPVVDVYVPEQDITRGAVQIVVLESRVGQVRAQGNRWFSSDFLVSQVRLAPGDRIHGTELLKDIDWLNTNPFRDVTLVLARGQARGVTDIVLKTRDRRPLRVYAGYENSGTELTGRDRYFTGANWGNAFGLDHQMSCQVTVGKDPGDQRAVSLSYEVPLPWRHRLTLLGAASRSRPKMDPFFMEGTSWELDGRYTIPLPHGTALRHRLELGMDYKHSDSDLAFSSIPVFDKETEVAQLHVAWQGTRFDTRGKTTLRSQLVASPGGLSSRNKDEAFQEIRPEATAKYAYATLDAERTTLLGERFSWVARVKGQLSGDRLLPGEQLELGGFGNLRGFEENEAAGDSGFMVQNELHGPKVALASGLPRLSELGALTGLVFWDYGSVLRHGDADHKTLSSLGVGARYALGSRVNLTLDMGWQVQGRSLDPDSSCRGQLSVLVSY